MWLGPQLPGLVARAKELGMTALALTDHGGVAHLKSRSEYLQIYEGYLLLQREFISLGDGLKELVACSFHVVLIVFQMEMKGFHICVYVL